MAITVTEKAVHEVRRIIEEQNYSSDVMLRVGVSGGGCSGLSYSLTFENQMNEDEDDVLDFHGLKVVVDEKSSHYLNGTSVDFYEGLERRGFVFNNPNATKSCGCGSSFST